jgi:ketosteroid isomerase-like protein
MGLSPAQIDRIIDQHFQFEATDDIEAVLASLADDAEHHCVPSPFGVLHDRSEIRKFYEMLFHGVRGERVTPVRRLYGDDFVVDESVWHGHFEDGRALCCDGLRGPVSFRILHVFEFRDGRISRENVWCDVAAIREQIGASAR